MEQWDGWLDVAKMFAAGLFGGGSVATYHKFARVERAQKLDLEDRMAEVERKVEASRVEIRMLQQRLDRGDITRAEADREIHDRLSHVDELLTEVRELIAAR